MHLKRRSKTAEEGQGGNLELGQLQTRAFSSRSCEERNEKHLILIGWGVTLLTAVVTKRVQHLFHEIDMTRVYTALMSELKLVNMKD